MNFSRPKKKKELHFHPKAGVILWRKEKLIPSRENLLRQPLKTQEKLFYRL